MALRVDTTRTRIRVDGHRDHVVDGGINQFLQTKFHRVPDEGFNHGHEFVHRIKRSKCAFDLILGFGDIDFKSHALVVKLLMNFGEVDDERVNARTIDKFPRFISGRVKQFPVNFADDRAIFPTLTENGGKSGTIWCFLLRSAASGMLQASSMCVIFSYSFYLLIIFLIGYSERKVDAGSPAPFTRLALVNGCQP